MWPVTLSGRLPIVGLVSRYPTNYLIGREPISDRVSPFTTRPCSPVVLCGISAAFAALSPCQRQVAHALLTRPPLRPSTIAHKGSPLDLHVLGTPPAFVLSQDQTLMFNPLSYGLGAFAPLPKDLHSLRIFCRSSLLCCIVFKVRPPPLFWGA